MKTVGKQLQDARQAKNWTPELAARETKIKVDRLRDLEADDYTHFSSPAYARGFVRTYARALGLDEYKILRQLDNKLPEDDNASFASDSGLPYIPEPSKPLRGGSSGSNAGLYIVMTLGCGVILVISFVLFDAYRTGELPHYFAHSSETNPAATNAAPNTAATEESPKALPVDASVAPATATESSPAPKALPVDNGPSVAATTNSNASPPAPRALPVNPAELANGSVPPSASEAAPNAAPEVTDGSDPTNAPRALPVDPSELTGMPIGAPPSPAPPPVAPPSTTITRDSARSANSMRVETPAPVPTPPPALPIVAGTTPAGTSSPLPAAETASASTATIPSGKRLILTASRDSFVRVTAVDAPDLEQVRFASVLHAGQSIGFDGRKFSINVGVPSAVDISLDGVNYGPHSDQEVPETFTVESHQP